MIAALGASVAQTNEEFVWRHELIYPDRGMPEFATFRRGLTGGMYRGWLLWQVLSPEISSGFGIFSAQSELKFASQFYPLPWQPLAKFIFLGLLMEQLA